VCRFFLFCLLILSASIESWALERRLTLVLISFCVDLDVWFIARTNLLALCCLLWPLGLLASDSISCQFHPSCRFLVGFKIQHNPLHIYWFLEIKSSVSLEILVIELQGIREICKCQRWQRGDAIASCSEAEKAWMCSYSAGQGSSCLHFEWWIWV